MKVYPQKYVGPMSVLNTDLIYGSLEGGHLFTEEGLRGKLHRDLTVDILLKTGVAFRRCREHESWVLQAVAMTKRSLCREF